MSRCAELYTSCTAYAVLLHMCSQQAAILEDLVTDVPLEFDFLFSSSHAEVISGKQEGERTDFFFFYYGVTCRYWIWLLNGCCLPVFVCFRHGCDDLFLPPLNPEGVYAWIGINFVLGRFDHTDEGECEGITRRI